ncbi:MDR family MFS transporter [Rubrobacter calidifluminis]|uniref:MDR family MFS transporter n=1 Tax=Rubrobacter calidifluminis TaxID=1392640 RepID=UPI002361B728|nr:MFS transporter [Rubrobacter calidifluminis]
MRGGNFDRRVWLLTGAMLAFRFGQGLYYPFSTIYFHDVVGIPLSLVGVGLGVLAAASVLSGLFSGPLSDRHGRRPLMLLSLAGSAVCFALFTRVDGFTGYLAVSALFGLVGSSMFDAARNAAVADVTPPERRSRAYGLVRVGGNAGWALGPLVAGLAASAAGGTGGTYRALFLGTAALTAAVMCVLALLLRESRPVISSRDEPGSSPRLLFKALSDGSFLALLGCGVLLYYVFTQDWQSLPIYAKDFLGVPDGRVGLFLGANGVVVIALQMPVSRLIDRSSKRTALLCGAALFAASALTLLLTSSFAGILVAFAGFFTLAEMVVEVAGPALTAGLAPPALRGTYLSLFGACYGVAYGISPVVAGVLLQERLPEVIWALQIAAALLAASLLLSLRGKRPAPPPDSLR